jgi:hypothetical protein
VDDLYREELAFVQEVGGDWSWVDDVEDETARFFAQTAARVYRAMVADSESAFPNQ